MSYGELIRLYFERCSALQWYWTLYVIVVGGLLAFSSLRQRPDLLTAGLVTVLFGCFAYKNADAIGDVMVQRVAVVQSMKDLAAPGADTADTFRRQRAALDPVLPAPPFEGARNFHVTSDLLTIAALWAMEWRRVRNRREEKRAGSAGKPTLGTP